MKIGETCSKEWTFDEARMTLGEGRISFSTCFRRNTGNFKTEKRQNISLHDSLRGENDLFTMLLLGPAHLPG